MAYLDQGVGEACVSPHIEQVLGLTQEEWLDDPVRWFQRSILTIKFVGVLRPRTCLSRANRYTLPTDLRVLIVDDSSDTVEMLRKLLEIEGAHPETAMNGAEALEILRNKKFDVLITDISLPAMDGFEVLRRVRSGSSTVALPAVALTGFGRAEDAARAAAEGFVAHLTKPNDFDKLVETLRSIPTLRNV